MMMQVGLSWDLIGLVILAAVWLVQFMNNRKKQNLEVA